MNKEVHINNVAFLPAPHVAKLLGYTPDYISKLAREKKIVATRVGRRWYVNLDSANHFKLETQRDKEVRANEIREERKLEQQQCTDQDFAICSPKLAIAETLLVVAIGLLVGTGGFFVVDSNNLPAQVERNSFERLAILVYDFFTFENEKVITVIETNSQEPFLQDDDAQVTTNEMDSGTTTFTTLIVAPHELFTETQMAEVRESFSDEVEIAVDPENPETGIITPIFRNHEGDEYRFLMMPIPKPDGF